MDYSSPNASDSGADRFVDIPYSGHPVASPPGPAAGPPATPRGLDPRPDAVAGGSGIVWFSASVLLLLAAWFVGPELVARYQYAATRGRVTAEYENARNVLADAPLAGLSSAYQLVAQRIRPSVVSIYAVDPPANGRTIRPSGGQGSGVIMSRDGYILTNRHVVLNARAINIMLDDRREFPATVIGLDERSDLAVLKIDAEGLLPAEWGDSDEVQVGSMVWAVGSPYGLQQTVTSGILSAKERRDASGDAQEYLQTDAAINPGNSGGPLVNAKGEVIGINTSIYGESFLGISFAVPSSIARFVFNQLVDHGRVTRGFLGILPREVVHTDLLRHGLPDLNGAVVQRIPGGGPAERSDLRVGDIIRRWEGKAITSYNTLYRYIGESPPNSRANVEIIRDGQTLRLQVPVGNATDYAERMR